jgi:hypothetical protein
MQGERTLSHIVESRVVEATTLFYQKTEASFAISVGYDKSNVSSGSTTDRLGLEPCCGPKSQPSDQDLLKVSYDV